MKNFWKVTMIGIIMLAALFTCTTKEQASAKTIKSAKSYVLSKSYKKATYYSSSNLCGNKKTTTLKYAGRDNWTCDGKLTGAFGLMQYAANNTYYLGANNSDWTIASLKFPVKKGQVIKEDWFGDIYTSKIISTNDKLTVASYNLENFSNNTKETTDDKARKLARAFASDMKNPDIIGVTEVQDNNGSSAGDAKADQSYQRLISEIKKAGGVNYNYVNIDPENNADGGAPNANIRVGFLYNPERV